MLALVAPVPVKNVELGQVAGRSRDDETAAFIMTVLLFMSIATYGAMVLSGVVEEKASRVVEVLLARMPARSLLAGKVTGIGLLGLAQIALTALVALVAVTMTDSADIPAVRGGVLAWVVVWFVLGYALYATVFGALGALASRPEDAQSAAGPVSVVLIAGYFVSFAAIGSPDTAWAKAVSFFPATAPLAMPNRIAMGATTWWEPVLAVAITLRGHRRPRAVRRPCLQRRHPPHRTHTQTARRMAANARTGTQHRANAFAARRRIARTSPRRDRSKRRRQDTS